jgi:hypothetical protein
MPLHGFLQNVSVLHIQLYSIKLSVERFGVQKSVFDVQNPVFDLIKRVKNLLVEGVEKKFQTCA